MLVVPFPDRSFMVATEYELPPFDLRRAMDTLAAKDPLLAPLIKETREFRVEKALPNLLTRSSSKPSPTNPSPAKPLLPSLGASKRSAPMDASQHRTKCSS